MERTESVSAAAAPPMTADDRLALLDAWLASTLEGIGHALAPASTDASFRRYFRVTLSREAHGARTLVAMDAPPPMEDCRPFVHVARLLADAGVHAPRVLAADLDRGFLLLTDLGTTTYLDALNGRAMEGDHARSTGRPESAAPSGGSERSSPRGDHNPRSTGRPESAAPSGGSERSSPRGDIYLDAIDALVRWQAASRDGELPPYDEALLRRELELFPDWYLAKHLGVEVDAALRATLDDAFALLVANALAQPRVYVHRDYHSRNLMVAAPNPGVLDFQDAVFGPITYDLVSLLRDAYVGFDEERQLDWAVRYWERARRARLPVDADFGVFWRDFEWMGVQRQLKVLGIFARLWHRDGKPGYLADMPRVLGHLRGACRRYAAFAPLLRSLDAIEGRAAVVGTTF